MTGLIIVFSDRETALAKCLISGQTIRPVNGITQSANPCGFVMTLEANQNVTVHDGIVAHGFISYEKYFRD